MVAMNARLQTIPVRPRNRLARLLRPMVAPQVFDFWAGQLNRAWSWERSLGRIVQIRRESADATTLVLQPNRHWLGFRPGQHLNIGAEIDGTRITRSYSLTGVPRGDGRISLTVKSIEGGRLSRHLASSARLGDVLELGQAYGEMTLPAQPAGQWLFLAAGSGITPLVAMVRELADAGMPVALDLVYWARTRAEFCFAQELRNLAAAHDGFTVHFVVTREAPLHMDESSGRIEAGRLSSLVADLDQRQVYACGPGAFVEDARVLLADRTAAFMAEAFTPPPRVVEDTGEVQVTLARSGRTLTLPRGESLLVALEAQGLRPASGCRMGICNTCSCAKQSGVTRHTHTGALAGEPVSALKLCISSAATDLVLDL